jgi:beta-lactamase superfamily II metal-dependent hydrolase
MSVLTELGIPFLQTGRDGAVEFSTDGRGMTVRSLRPPPQ